MSLRRTLAKKIGRWFPFLKPLVRRALEIAYGKRGFPVNIGGVGVFRLAPRFYFSGWESFGGGHNSCFRPCVEAARGRNCFIDVGAHIGLYSLPVSRALADGGMVYAFEPSSSNAAYLHRHLRYNGVDNIVVEQTLVGEQPAADVLFYEPVESGSPVGGLLRFSDDVDYRETHRAQVSIDGYCELHGLHPDVMKIDAEGSEVMILRGARGALLRDRPIVFLSVHPGRIEQLGGSLDELGALLDSVRYSLFDADGARVAGLRGGEFIVRPD